METLQQTGGGMIGRARATWPFATLKVSADRLELNVSMVGKVVFSPADVTAIEIYRRGLSSGIRIRHTVPSYEEHIIFWTMGTAQGLLSRIKNTGFLNNTKVPSLEETMHISEIQTRGTRVIKKQWKIAGVVLWNALFISDFYRYYKGDIYFPLGPGVQMALGVLFFTCLLLLVSGAVRRVILVEGKTIDDIRRGLLFAMLISGLMLFQLFVFLPHLRR